MRRAWAFLSKTWWGNEQHHESDQHKTAGGSLRLKDTADSNKSKRSSMNESGVESKFDGCVCQSDSVSKWLNSYELWRQTGLSSN